MKMIITLQADPKDFFRTKSIPSNAELLKLVEKAASMGFKAIQIGPLTGYVDIEGERLRKALDSLKMERTVHVGGVFDAESFNSRTRIQKSAKANSRRSDSLQRDSGHTGFGSSSFLSDNR